MRVHAHSNAAGAPEWSWPHTHAPQGSVALSSQLASLQLELAAVQHKLVAKEASARKYKEAVRLLKVGHMLACWVRV